jgi:hypothetical protein
MEDRMSEANSEHRMYMGIGDAILRLVHVERMYADGVDPGEVLVTERNMIIQALNQQYQLDLGFDCNMDGVPDTIEIFMQSAQTSCCRILPMDDGPKKEAPKKRAKSRLKATPLPEALMKATPKKATPKKAVAAEPAPEVAVDPEPKPTTRKKKRGSSRRRRESTKE